jgi:hypothetical protein
MAYWSTCPALVTRSSYDSNKWCVHVHAKVCVRNVCAQLMLSVKSIVMRVEASAPDGKRTLPMVVVDTSLTGSVRNWSSMMHAELTLTLTVSGSEHARIYWTGGIFQ